MTVGKLIWLLRRYDPELPIHMHVESLDQEQWIGKPHGTAALNGEVAVYCDLQKRTAEQGA